PSVKPVFQSLTFDESIAFATMQVSNWRRASRSCSVSKDSMAMHVSFRRKPSFSLWLNLAFKRSRFSQWQRLGTSSKAVIDCKRRKSAGGRRPVIKPALGIEIRRWDHHRDRKHRRSRRLKKGETRSRSRPLECVAKQALPLDVRRLRLYGCYLLDFATERRVTSRKACRERKDG